MKNLIPILFSILLMNCSPGETADKIIENAVDKIETQQVKNSSFDYGNSKSGIYTNTYFDFKLEFDTSWSIQSHQQMNALSEKGKQLLDDNSFSKKEIEAAEINSAHLFGMFKHEVGSAVQFNPSMVIMAENTKHAPGIKNGKDYLFHLKNNLKQTKLNYTFEEEYSSKQLANYNFDILKGKLDLISYKVTQEYLTTVAGNFTLSIIISYGNEEEKSELYRVIESMQAI
tara:strand:+ start:303 stop:989 length:687 start_codon:yes stop_codon:yes gene_type:complete